MILTSVFFFFLPLVFPQGMYFLYFIFKIGVDENTDHSHLEQEVLGIHDQGVRFSHRSKRMEHREGNSRYLGGVGQPPPPTPTPRLSASSPCFMAFSRQQKFAFQLGAPFPRSHNSSTTVGVTDESPDAEVIGSYWYPLESYLASSFYVLIVLLFHVLVLSLQSTVSSVRTEDLDVPIALEPDSGNSIQPQE